MINKRCITAFSPAEPLCVFGSKSKLFDPTFSLTSELTLCEHNTGVLRPPLLVANRFNNLRWCTRDIVFGTQENCAVSAYRVDTALDTGIELVYENADLFDGDVLGLDYAPDKKLVVCGAKTKLLLFALDALKQPFNSGIAVDDDILSLNFNKVNRILAVGTTKNLLIFDMKQKKEILKIKKENVTAVSFSKGKSTSLVFVSSDEVFVFDLLSDELTSIAKNRIGFCQADVLVLYGKNEVDVFDYDFRRVSATPVDDVFDLRVSEYNSDIFSLSHLKGSVEFADKARFCNDQVFFRGAPGRGFYAPRRSPCVAAVRGAVIESRSGDFYVRADEFPDMEKTREGGAEKTDCVFWKLVAARGDAGAVREVLLGTQDLFPYAIDAAPGERERSDFGDLKIDLGDEITLALVNGNLDGARNAATAGQTAPLSLVIAIVDNFLSGRQVVVGDADARILLLATMFTKDLAQLRRFALSEWRAQLCFLCNFGVAELQRHALALARELAPTHVSEALVCFLLGDSAQEFVALRNKTYTEPRSVYEYAQCIAAYKNVHDEFVAIKGKSDTKMHREFLRSIGESDGGAACEISEKIASLKTSAAAATVRRVEPRAAKAEPGFSPNTTAAGRSEQSFESGALAGAGSSFMPGFSRPRAPAPIPGFNASKISTDVSAMPAPAIPRPAASFSQPQPPAQAEPPKLARSTYGASTHRPVQPSFAKPPVAAKPVPETPERPMMPRTASAAPPAPSSDEVAGAKAFFDEFDAKIRFLKDEALLKKGLIYKSKTNSALARLRAYETKDRAQFPPALVASLRQFFALIDEAEIRARKDEIKGRLLAEGSNACDRVVREFAGVAETEVWLPAVFSMLQVALS